MRNLLAGLAALFAAIGLGSGVARAEDITFWTWRQEDKAVYTKLFDEFTKQNPDIHVAFQAFPPADYQTIVSTALAGGKGPDVLHTRAYGGLEQLATPGYLVELTPQNVPELANLPDDAKAALAVRSDGKIYSFAFSSQTLGILVNKDALAAAKVAEPRTWDEFLAACKAIQATGKICIANGTATGWMDEVFAGDLTGPMLGQQFFKDVVAGKTTFKDPKYAAALGKLLELKPFMPPGFTGIDYPTAQQLFLSGRAAMFVGGSWEIANFHKQNPKLALDFMAPPAPGANSPQLVSKFYDGGYAVVKSSQHQKAALALVRFMGTKEFGDQLGAMLGDVSPIKGVTLTDPMLAKVAAMGKESVPYIMAVSFRYENPTGSELLQGSLQKMFAGSMTPEQVGAFVTDGIAKYYKPFQGK
jgi:raffinose/stachyose/melibiose transport system substrate-binding protein